MYIYPTHDSLRNTVSFGMLWCYLIHENQDMLETERKRNEDTWS